MSDTPLVVPSIDEENEETMRPISIGSSEMEMEKESVDEQPLAPLRKKKQTMRCMTSTTSKKLKSTCHSINESNNAEPDNVDEQYFKKKTRKKTSVVWKYMVEVTEDGQKMARCSFCNDLLSRGDSSSTSALKRLLISCMKLNGAMPDQLQEFGILPMNEKSDPISTVGTFKYDHAKMCENVSHYILINELPFLHVESFMFNELMETATPHWKKISRATAKADCVSTFEIEKKKLIELFKSVNKVNITTDMWTSSNQKLGYMVVTGHWVSDQWKLNTRVLNFCNVPPPHSGYVIADALTNCFVQWGIRDKIGTITVDNAKANDLAVKTLKETFQVRKKLCLDGNLFHVRCCAHILNLLVQDGLKPIESIVDSVRDGVKYISGSEGRRRKFAEIAQKLNLSPKKLILDVPTRWNSTFNMLNTVVQFSQVFPRFANWDMSFFKYVPSFEDWQKVKAVCSLLEDFYQVTKNISGSEYPICNLFLADLRRVKQVIDSKILDEDYYIREIARLMKEKFDKYWGESNLVISLGAVLDPRYKMALPKFCFPSIYPQEGESTRNLIELENKLKLLFNEYLVASSNDSTVRSEERSNYCGGSLATHVTSTQGTHEFNTYLHQSGVGQPALSELDRYLGDHLHIPKYQERYNALTWLKEQQHNYPILSLMARDILAIPVSTVASESTFSAGSRVIEPHRASLLPKTVEMLICGADWARELYGLKKTYENKQVKDIEIELDDFSNEVTSGITTIQT